MFDPMDQCRKQISINIINMIEYHHWSIEQTDHIISSTNISNRNVADYYYYFCKKKKKTRVCRHRIESTDPLKMATSTF